MRRELHIRKRAAVSVISQGKIFIRHASHHLAQAAKGIEATFANVERESGAGPAFDGTQALALLKKADGRLESVSKLTPGFRLVDASNSCCGFCD